jgi:hypothetical protein
VNTTLLRRIAAIEARQPPALPRIVRVVVDVDREPIGAVVRPGHTLIQREVGEPLAALIERAEASR